MKKLMTVCLAATLILSLAGCAGSVTPEQRYEAVRRQMQEQTPLSSMEYRSKTTMRVAFPDQVVDLVSSEEVQLSQPQENPVMAIFERIRLVDREAAAEFYYRDGWLYASSDGQSYKVPMDKEALLEELAVRVQPQGMLPAVEETDHFSARLQSGRYTYTYSIKPEAVGLYTGPVSEVLNYLVPTQYVQLTAINGYVVTDLNNRLQSSTIRYSMKMPIEPQSRQDISIEISSVYDKVGEAVSINFPAQLESYPAVSVG